GPRVRPHPEHILVEQLQHLSDLLEMLRERVVDAHARWYGPPATHPPQPRHASRGGARDRPRPAPPPPWAAAAPPPAGWSARSESPRPSLTDGPWRPGSRPALAAQTAS